MTESDTVIVTSDGRAMLDVEKLFAKPHIQALLALMRRRFRR